FEVTIIDKTEMKDGCSFGNAGIIVPSHSVPLASPGVIAQGIRWMFSASSPFFIRPRLDPDLLRWLWRFYRSCTKEHVERATPVLRDFHLLSKSLYQEFASKHGFAFDLEERGSLMLYRTPKAEREEKDGAESAYALGLHVSLLSPAQIKELDPGTQCDVLGGILYHDDAHLYPGKFVLHLQEALKGLGVKFLTSHAVSGFQTVKDRITQIRFADGSVEEAKEVVLASGAWSGKLAKQLGIPLLIQDGKGYSVTLKNPVMRPAIPSILTEVRVAVTPMGDDLRIGGTLEVSNFSDKINDKRVSAILKAMTEYYPDFPMLDTGSVNIWHGYRPVSADGLPYVGRPQRYRNLIIAAGHAMLGMSLGPATGLLVSEIAQGTRSSLNMTLFSPDRHSN
ncbi:MAG TPA: FAD-dependent oxidoreductase, partial [Saprospiraceae bacterium]|nr:FAD-dependent oxidoreductase [Saprospiraceae bacterium]